MTSFSYTLFQADISLAQDENKNNILNLHEPFTLHGGSRRATDKITTQIEYWSPQHVIGMGRSIESFVFCAE